MGYDIDSREVITREDSKFGKRGETAYFRASIGVAFIPRIVSGVLGISGIVDVWANGVSGDGEHHFDVADCIAAKIVLNDSPTRERIVKESLDRLFGFGEHRGNGVLQNDEWRAEMLMRMGVERATDYINDYLDYLVEIADLGGAYAG